MGTHHILKDGTSYAIKGGTDLIAGTSYQIGGGRTLVNGTAYEIGFAEPVSLTWYLSKRPPVMPEEGKPLYGKFTSDGKTYSMIYAGNYQQSLNYAEDNYKNSVLVYDGVALANYMSEALRTIVFDEPPEGSMLEWLESTATPQ